MAPRVVTPSTSEHTIHQGTPPTVALESSAASQAEAGDESTSASEGPASHEARLSPPLPGLTVIVPVRNDPENLEVCLEALWASDHPAFEIVVVDDASTDTTGEVARRSGAQVLRLESRSGPAAARNLGSEVARYSHLFFVDADVRVAPDTLRRVWARFEADPKVDALFGSYDDKPGAPNLLSQYRNLLHHHVHQAGRRTASSFWSGCGAIEHSVFRALGGFDAGYDNASVEDIELGSRLRQNGYRVELVKDLQVQHLKRWTFAQMIQTDVQSRGVPWTLLLLRQGKIPNDLNLRYGQRLSALFACGLALALAVGTWLHPWLAALPGITLAAIVGVDRWTQRRPIPRWLQWLIVGGLGAASGVSPARGGLADLAEPWFLAALVCLLGIVVLNGRFYGFLFRVQDPLFALLAVPLHVLYYLYSTFAFAYGLVVFLGRRPADVDPAERDS